MAEPLLRATNIHKIYPTGTEKTLAVLRGISFDVPRGIVVAIVGASGAGKSTLLHIIGGLDRATQGNVYVEDDDISRFDDKKLSQFRNQNIGFVFQFHHLLPEFTALENIMMPALIGGMNAADAREKAMRLLTGVALTERARHKPSELSGGEQQRVAVARALMNAPKLVLADEPSGNLDEDNAASLHDMLWQLAHEQQQTIIVVTHNAELAKRADVILRLHEGLLE